LVLPILWLSAAAFIGYFGFVSEEEDNFEFWKRVDSGAEESMFGDQDGEDDVEGETNDKSDGN